MIGWAYALCILSLEGIILSLVKKHVSHRDKFFATLAIIGFIVFLFVANTDEARISFVDSARQSKIAPWIAVAALTLLAFFQVARPDNIFTTIARDWNKDTHYLLFVSLVLVITTAVTIPSNN